ncbi:radical SAM enzyme, Cfr family [Solidesulfovibrio carbinoliphilus subsp. oakridgensis]|uniref:Probable dual-specificity RNA methyltransferase RlmN n=1 Tax=Solidesulfovibrio carbinoliphilus subsp. oakridgensis TaxID=694327 RepID=G7Q8B9_9BACT|nr:23S rRNA (adenine(2503)-C(2))-methyltransferase RlmN [Solidesulfovibrio carbinoliphilus]EHJ48531.1 radical SAM enzyme, Cfr family [Solidesulfovibrio carbinoliphilus subsp. oakridgensis]
MTNLIDLTFHELETLVVSLGEPPYRARQVWQWLWQKGCRDIAAMTDTSKALRARLAEVATIAWPQVARVSESADGTVKFLLTLGDGESVECVLIPEKDHYTACLSTQVGCAMGCAFCATGMMGFRRNMTPGEMLGQVLVARQYLLEKGVALALRNLVFMGMGEPLLNYDNLVKTLEALHHPQGFDISGRRITVSTAGVARHLLDLGRTGLCSLAVSLHAPTQALREKIMPGAAKLPLGELIEILRQYPMKPRERLTFEYLMLDGVNDSLEDARELVRLLSRVKAKVNLIVFNATPGLPYQPPPAERVFAFQEALKAKGLTATVRKSKGADIAAACGQLRAECEGEGAAGE